MLLLVRNIDYDTLLVINRAIILPLLLVPSWATFLYAHVNTSHTHVICIYLMIMYICEIYLTSTMRESARGEGGLIWEGDTHKY